MRVGMSPADDHWPIPIPPLRRIQNRAAADARRTCRTRDDQSVSLALATVASVLVAPAGVTTKSTYIDRSDFLETYNASRGLVDEYSRYVDYQKYLNFFYFTFQPRYEFIVDIRLFTGAGKRCT